MNEEVLDAMAQLTNMIVGSVKVELESKLGPLGLSVPTVVYGRISKPRPLARRICVFERRRTRNKLEAW